MIVQFDSIGGFQVIEKTRLIFPFRMIVCKRSCGAYANDADFHTYIAEVHLQLSKHIFVCTLYVMT